MSYIRIPTEVTIPVTVDQGGTGSTAAFNNSRVMVSSAGTIVESTYTTTQLAATSYWTKYSVTYLQLSAAALTNDIELFSLPAKAVVQKVIIKSTTAFTGGIIATYTLSVGIVGTLAKYIAAFDVLQAVSNTVFSVGATTINVSPENFGSVTSIRVAATSTDANLSAATAGGADIYVLTSLLP